jgi:tetratricopeptide (TPR) repeat protein
MGDIRLSHTHTFPHRPPPFTRITSTMTTRAALLLSFALLFAGVTLPARATTATPADTHIREGLAAEARLDTPRALEAFLAADQLKPDDAFILQKIARHYSDSIVDLPSDAVAEKKRRAQLALDYSRRAVVLDPNNAENILSLAICHGTLAVYSDTRTKITYSRLVKEDAERALALNPDYDWAHHVLGRWHYEVATLGATTRFFVRVIYGALPDASVTKAITHLERAVTLAPQVSPHHLELGFAYLAADRLADARAAFNRGLSLPSAGKHDEAAKARAREALQSLG